MNKHEIIKDSDAIYFCDSCGTDRPCRLILDQEDSFPTTCVYESDGDNTAESEWQLVDRN